MEQKLKCDVYIGKNLRRLREKFGLSQEKLCAELQCRNCDIGRSTYAKYENGELNIRISVLMELKKIYNCSYENFLMILIPIKHKINSFWITVPKTIDYIILLLFVFAYLIL